MGRCPSGKCLDVFRRDLDRRAERRHSAVRLGSEEFSGGGVTVKLPKKGVLASTGAYDQDSHVAEFRLGDKKKKG
jgi:hypothetical protein